MTAAIADARVRELLSQSSTNTEFSPTMVGALVNQGRRLLASILPEKLLLQLRVYESTVQNITSGQLAYRTDFLRCLKNKVVKSGEVSPPTIIATELKENEEWRLKFQESNDLIKSSATIKYYREKGQYVEFYPATDTYALYPYLKCPDDLTDEDNKELSKNIEDLTIRYAFERCMGTKRGDLELAVFLSKSINIDLEGMK